MVSRREEPLTLHSLLGSWKISASAFSFSSFQVIFGFSGPGLLSSHAYLISTTPECLVYASRNGVYIYVYSFLTFPSDDPSPIFRFS